MLDLRPSLLAAGAMRRLVLVVVVTVTATTLGAWGQGQRMVPEGFTLSEAASNAIGAAWLTDAERSALRVFHGVWDDRDLETVDAQARVALNAWRFDDPALLDPATSIDLRGEALFLRGDLSASVDLLATSDTVAAASLRARALEASGQFDDSLEAVKPVIHRLLRERLEEPSELTHGVRALATRARVEGQPGRDYQSMIALLSRVHQELDRLYWPAKLAEAELLWQKSNDAEAIAALHEVLALNPRCAQAWYVLGRIALERFDFDGAKRAVEALRRVDQQHPLAHLLYAELRMIEEDPDEAHEVLTRVTARWPKLRPAQALLTAATALLYDDEATKHALVRYDELSPGSADAYFAAGRMLSMFRQYDAAAGLLDEAVRRQPGWPAPRIELGLMEMQTGRDDRALDVLRAVAELDRFNKRAANSLQLLEELAEYQERETEHFVIRYKPGIDEVMVELMPDQLEELHAIVSERFGWELERKTIIELMPDHKRFSVRITGMPHIHTIAACTGPIIAMEVPRDGPPSVHLGPFDWRRVLQHEYTHTITLDQTRFRIPHWLTEAAAVSLERAPRNYRDCMMLANAWRSGTLFTLDEIKWAFVRPQRAGDRGKAYAQGHWMVEFMDERFGPSALVRLLARYFDGEREAEAIPNALGISREQFFADFLVWAGTQVEAWGLAPQPSMIELTDTIRAADSEMALMMAASRQAWLDAIAKTMLDRIGEPAAPGDRPFTADQWPDLVRAPVEIDDRQLEAWRDAHPDHPDLLAESLRRRIESAGGPNASHVADLERLALLRPVDMYPHRKLAQFYLASETPAAAIPHLEALDVREDKTAVYARQLAALYREQGDRDAALAKAERAVRFNPYRADMRELAAAAAVESRQLDRARLHVHALTRLEPDRPQHERRLARLDQLLKR